MTADLGFQTVQGHPVLAVHNQCTEWLFLLQYSVIDCMSARD